MDHSTSWGPSPRPVGVDELEEGARHRNTPVGENEERLATGKVRIDQGRVQADRDEVWSFPSRRTQALRVSRVPLRPENTGIRPGCRAPSCSFRSLSVYPLTGTLYTTQGLQRKVSTNGYRGTTTRTSYLVCSSCDCHQDIAPLAQYDQFFESCPLDQRNRLPRLFPSLPAELWER